MKHDVSVVSIYTKGHDEMDDLEGAAPAAILAGVKERIQKRLNDKVALKNKHYQGITPHGFHALIFTSGGVVASATEPVLDFWRTVMGQSAYLSLYKSIGIALLRGQSRTMAL